MPALAIAAGATIIGGVANGIGASNAAKTAAKSAAEQKALSEANYAKTQGYYANDLASGDAASGRMNDLLGLSGNKVDVGAILASTPGYQYRVQQGLDAVNSNAWASGGGMSGAALKALQTRGDNLADQGFNTYLGQINTIADRGSAAKAALAQAGQVYTNNTNQITQQAGEAKAANQVFQASNIGNIIKGVAGAAGGSGALMGSSYAPQAAANALFNNVTNATRATTYNPVISNFSTPNLLGR